MTITYFTKIIKILQIIKPVIPHIASECLEDLEVSKQIFGQK